MLKRVYIRVTNDFAERFEQKDFHFTDVEIEDTANYLTIWDNDGTLAFRCPISGIERFAKIKN